MESYMRECRAVLIKRRPPPWFRAQTLVSDFWVSTPLNNSVTLSKLLTISISFLTCQMCVLIIKFSAS